jgi:hypothetical protein
MRCRPGSPATELQAPAVSDSLEDQTLRAK